MPDPRVLHFWDGEHQLGQWFAREVDGFEGIAWDVYYLYGPEATWETIAAPLVGTGGTIYDERYEIETQLAALIEK